MDESAHNQRLLRAALVSVVIVTAWSIIFPPQKPKKRPAKTPAVATSTDTDKGTAKPTAPRPTATSSLAAARPERPEVEPRSFDFVGAAVDPNGNEAPIPFSLSLSNVGGGIERFTLPSFKQRDAQDQPTEDPVELVVPVVHEGDLHRQMAGLSFDAGSTFSLPVRPVYEVVRSTADQVTYRYVTDAGVEIEREYHLSADRFSIEMAVTVRNKSKAPQKHIMRLTSAASAAEPQKSSFFSFDGIAQRLSRGTQVNGACFTDGSAERELRASLEKETEKFTEGVKWVAVDWQYFLSALIQRDGTGATCEMSADKDTVVSSLILPAVTLQPGAEKRHKFTAYLGVKKPALLTRAEAELESAIDYTIMGLDLAIICRFLLAILAWLSGMLGSWGWAIIGLTVLTKLVLFPLNQKAGKSQRAMAALRPELEKLKERFPDDKQRQAEEQMKLFKEHGANPAGGCVPMLLQMPIWLALYRSLWVSVDLYQQPFLWVPDLTARDPYWILPVLLTLAMWVQQKLLPTAMDPAQQKMMQFMPIMFGGFMMFLAAGLCFYILVNTLLTIVQQHLINKAYGPIGGPPSEQRAPA